MALLALLTTLLAASATAASNARGVDASIASKQTCITKYGPAAQSVSPLPTRKKTSAQTVSSTVTTCGAASTTTVTITPDAITSTVYVDATSSLLPPGGFVTELATVPTECSVTSTISAGVATIYTGAYNATAATNTATPFAISRSVDERRKTSNVNLFHVFGQQRIFSQKQKQVAVVCLEQVTTYYITTSTLVEEPKTETATAAQPTVYITAAQRVAVGPTAQVSITATIIAPPAETSAQGICTVTSAESTTTQHLKCAPTNLVSSVNGKGIGQTGGDSASTRGLAPGSDPSDCCQLCIDDEDCAASEDDPDAGNCFLWYTTPSCGLGFRYSDGGQNLKPGQGFIVQTGCGTMQAVDSF